MLERGRQSVDLNTDQQMLSFPIKPLSHETTFAHEHNSQHNTSSEAGFPDTQKVKQLLPP